VPGTVRAIVARMDYLPASGDGDWRAGERLRQQDPDAAVVSVYARGRDYHKVLRNRLQSLAGRIQDAIGPFGFRVFTDSAPVMELPLAEKAGLGWRGKHTLLLSRAAGSTFFIGEILVDLPLPVDPPTGAHCGQCQACIDLCPTGAILGPGKLDARRCISYLTIELKNSIPEELRPLIGNRIYGCDDCQVACPWNKFAQRASVPDFDERNGLGEGDLLGLFAWDEEEFNRRMEGSPIRRIGHERWLRNLAVGLGNAAEKKRGDTAIVAALRSRLDHPSELVREHVAWAGDAVLLGIGIDRIAVDVGGLGGGLLEVGDPQRTLLAQLAFGDVQIVLEILAVHAEHQDHVEGTVALLDDLGRHLGRHGRIDLAIEHQHRFRRS
jgi:epoxyqueuosine reductase